MVTQKKTESGQPCLACLQVEKENCSVERCAEGRGDGPKEKGLNDGWVCGLVWRVWVQFLVPSLPGTCQHFLPVNSC